MFRSEILRALDVRDAYRLMGECRDLGSDPALWGPRLCEGVRKLVGDAQSCAGEGLAPGPNRPLTPLSGFQAGMDPKEQRQFNSYLRDHGPGADPFFRRFTLAAGQAITCTRREVIRDGDYQRAPIFEEHLGPANVWHRLGSFHWPSRGAALTSIHLHRARGERDFSARERTLINFLHAELGPLVGRALVSIAEPSPDGLPPRLRQTLAYLLEGDSEKQVAARLGLSTTTAHQYVTTLYRRLGVRSRAQLMAYAFRRSARGPWRRLVRGDC